MSTIAIDGRKYHDFGIGTYIQNLLSEYEHLNHSHTFLLYVSQDEKDNIPTRTATDKRPVPYGKYSIGEIMFLGRRALRDGCDIFHAPHYTLPYGLRKKSVVTIHDLIHLRFPALFSPIQRLYSFTMIRHAVSNSGAIIVDSEFTKRDLMKSFAVAEGKVTVIHLGVSGQFKPAGPARVAEFRLRHGLRREFCLFVGNTKPHKGIEILLRAFAGTGRKLADTELVFAGGSLGKDPELRRLSAELGIGSRIRDIGHLSNEDLIAAYSAAGAFVLPSLYEGFGLPAIEAMACGAPVVVSDAGALPEIVGDAAAIVKKGHIPELSEAITEVLRNPTLVHQLRKKGTSNASRFSWRETARQTLAVYERVIGESS